jgi:hypothetical protein
MPAEVRAWLDRQRALGIAVVPIAKSADMRKGEAQ